MKKVTIALDGFSSTGKSTVAKRLARELGYVYVDTGAMYRAVTLYALRKGYIGETEKNVKALIDDLPQLKLSFQVNFDSNQSEIHLNGENVEGEIRNLRVSNKVSKIAAIQEVRQKLVEQQQKMGLEKGIVMDGRDIGTVVFPEAELKVFMTASPEHRAQRRYKELLERGEDITYEAVLKNVQERDYIDSNREISPLRKAEDAIEFDNSNLSLEEQFQAIYKLALEKIEA
ncbi:(d)CMP kinase [Croceivirga thetidis]|uniref:Cytidylate kinase n=1 Tax=Croceivirga thetidis TaxID=2721623 RepID=A0ABX1GSA6_9FLAO|nr:(d)CMP kinase [Croceivirga thetidis]NKI31915.1 (d)CMP kinase [Croceivirga thetidis]